MANTYLQDDNLATDTTFQTRVKYAALSCASDITSEGSAPANHVNRSTLATKVMNNPDGYAVLFAKAICAIDQNLTSASTDATIKADISAVWNSMSGGL